MAEHNPKIFLSYCQKSIEFSDEVLKFSNKLRSEGIDTILDQYEESPKEGWPRWMENSINESDYIILICNQEYLNRLSGKAEKGVGRGVKWESNIIYQHLYNDDTLNERFIPVVFQSTDTAFIPMPLQGVSYYDVSKSERYDSLYWRLRGISKNEKPQLGKLRPLPAKERKSLFITTPIDLESWDKAIWRGAAFLMDVDDEEPPCLLLPYSKEYYAKKIFKDWISIYGKEDKFDELRVAIIEGDIPGEDTGYTIHISSNIDRAAKRMEEQGFEFEESLLMSISRMQRANPTDNFKMLNIFKTRFQKHKKYFLMPAVLDEKNRRIKPLTEYRILKQELIFRHVSEIGEHDIDTVVIQKNKPWREY
ncbi:toll/interleukin-1 receptor domain-containing protein [Paenibacillus sp. D51F]